MQDSMVKEEYLKVVAGILVNTFDDGKNYYPKEVAIEHNKASGVYNVYIKVKYYDADTNSMLRKQFRYTLTETEYNMLVTFNDLEIIE